MFETTVREGVCRLGHSDARWLATGWDGGYHTAEAAFNCTVPQGFDRTDLEPYVSGRLRTAGFERGGPALLTGVDLAHARGAHAEGVTALATVGLSNPATLPVDEDVSREVTGASRDTERGEGDAAIDHRPGTVNLLVGTTRALTDGALATLLGTAVEAKTATLHALTGFTGTTSDAVAVGCVPDGRPTEFAGSATAVGAATRACVRDAIAASLDSRYPDGEWPTGVTAADHGVVTDPPTEGFRP